MKERIQQIIERKGQSARQFVDRIGVQRSTFSHILNGRNGVSTEVISCIHLAFPKISVQWLMFGEGGIFEVKNNPYPVNVQASLFEENSKILTEGQLFDEYRKENASNPPLNVYQASVLEEDKPCVNEVVREVVKNRKVTKIMIFYDDNTFETFSPDLLVG